MEFDKYKFLDLARTTFCLRSKVNEAVAKEFYLSPIEVELLSFLYIFPDMPTATDIERERSIKKNTISVHVENLVKLGLLERQEEHGDRRKVRLLLTDKAKPIAQMCIKGNDAVVAALQKGLTPDELDTIKHCFEVINENAVNLLKKMSEK